MVHAVKSDFRVFERPESLFPEMARSIAAEINSATLAGRNFCLALAGGNTPRSLYAVLSAGYRDEIAWNKVHVFWGDERFVPASDPSSNYRMACDSLLNVVPIPPQNVHPMPTDLADPDQAAKAYENTLKTFFHSPWPRFDLILLGMGAEGHTASLFPDSPALLERDKWVVATHVPVPPPVRLTLTLPVLNHAAQIHFLATGSEKAEALRQAAMTVRPEASSVPAAQVRSMQGKVVWWIDRAVASLLPASILTGQDGR